MKSDRSECHINGGDKKLFYHTIVVEKQFTEEVTKKLIQRCKKEECTVGTAIHTALSVAVAEQAKKNKTKKRYFSEQLYAATNVDMRKLASRFIPNYRNLDGILTGYYGGFTFLTYNSLDSFTEVLINREKLWSLAADLKLDCQNLFKRGRHLYISQIIGLHLTQKIMDFLNTNYIRNNGKIRGTMGFLLSNMGDLGGETSNSTGYLNNKPTLFSSEELHSFPHLSAVHSAVTVNGPDPQPIIGSWTFSGKLHLFGVFPASSCDREGAQNFLNRAAEILISSL